MGNNKVYTGIIVRSFVFFSVEVFLMILALKNPRKEVFILILLYQLQIVIVTQAKHIKNHLFRGAVYVRRSLYFLPYIISLYWFNSQLLAIEIYTFKSMSACVLAFLLAILLYIPQMKKIRIYFLKDFNRLLGPRSNQEVILDVYSSLMSAIFQEIFYKCCIVHVLMMTGSPIYAINIAALLFLAEHYFHFASGIKFNWKDYATQFLMSGLGGWLYLYSGMVLPSIIMHLTYNSPRTISYMVRNYQNRTC